MKRINHIYGLDLGQTSDPSALALLERAEDEDPQIPTEYTVRSLRRWPLGTPYPDIVDEVLKAVSFERLIDPGLVVDQTGVGRAVVDLFRGKVKCGFHPVTITGGTTASHTDDGWHVPKKDLVGVMQVLMGHRRFFVPDDLREGELLLKELHNFKVKVTPSANEIFGAWREGEHDDLVLAVAIAAWLGEKVMRWECPSSLPDTRPPFRWKRDPKEESPWRRLVGRARR